MKVEEALFKCKYEIYFDCGTEDEDDLENIVIQALEKQIPKKPEYSGDGYSDGKLVYDYAKCPTCGNDNFEYDINNWGCKFCPDCGQALDWSETDG